MGVENQKSKPAKILAGFSGFLKRIPNIKLHKLLSTKVGVLSRIFVADIEELLGIE